jgi:hypothetical protein
MRSQIILSTTDHLSSRLLRWFSGSAASHAAILYFDATFESSFVLESTHEGLHLTPWKIWRQKNKMLASFAVAVPDEAFHYGIKRIGAWLDTPYDYRGLLGHWWARIIKGHRHRIFQDPRKLLCSEAVGLYLAFLASKHPPLAAAVKDPPPDRYPPLRESASIFWTPDLLWRFASEHPDLFHIRDGALHTQAAASPPIEAGAAGNSFKGS